MIWVNPPDGGPDIPMDGSEIDSLYAEVLYLRKRVQVLEHGLQSLCDVLAGQSTTK